jgi:predicted ATPase
MDGFVSRLEISGYKSFENFAIDFEPFTVIAGVNGVGKSNLFDALRHLSALVSKTVRESFETGRGSLFDLFTLYPNGKRNPHLSYAVEVLLPKIVVDQFDTQFELKYRRVRYELEVHISDEGKLTIAKERLIPIKREHDQLLDKFPDIRKDLPRLTGGRTPFIDTQHGQLSISQDGNSGNKRTVNLSGAQRTVLSSITTVEFPHAYAVKRLLETIHFLQINPEKLRQPSSMAAPALLGSDGENLAAVVARMFKTDPDLQQMISNDLATIIPAVKEIHLEPDPRREEYSLSILHTDGHRIPAKLLSDGTLRILALIVMGYDPEFAGVVILEEPENGVHPGRIPEVVRLLESITSLKEQIRQVIVNTHSSKLINYVKDNKNLVIATSKTIVSREQGSYVVTEMTYTDGDLLSPGQQQFARVHLLGLLDSKAAATL